MKRWQWCVPLVAAAALAGCGSAAAHSGTPAASSGASKATSTSSSSGAGATGNTGSSGSISTTPTTPTASTTSTSTASTATGPSRCSTSQLSGALTDGNGAAGSVDYELVLTNRSSTACVVEGYPGVSFVAGSHGTQIGQPAHKYPGPEPVVTLAPGRSASAALEVVDALNYPQSTCHPTKVLGLRVYPPDQYTALFVPHDDEGCDTMAVSILDIKPFVAG